MVHVTKSFQKDASGYLFINSTIFEGGLVLWLEFSLELFRG